MLVVILDFKFKVVCRSIRGVSIRPISFKQKPEKSNKLSAPPAKPTTTYSTKYLKLTVEIESLFGLRTSACSLDNVRLVLAFG